MHPLHAYHFGQLAFLTKQADSAENLQSTLNTLGGLSMAGGLGGIGLAGGFGLADRLTDRILNPPPAPPPQNLADMIQRGRSALGQWWRQLKSLATTGKPLPLPWSTRLALAFDKVRPHLKPYATPLFRGGTALTATALPLLLAGRALDAPEGNDVASVLDRIGRTGLAASSTLLPAVAWGRMAAPKAVDALLQKAIGRFGLLGTMSAGLGIPLAFGLMSMPAEIARHWRQTT